MPTESPVPQRDELFETYLTTSYLPLNDLSAAGLEGAVRRYELDFGPHMPADRESAILELGCGVGGFLDYCRRSGYTDVRGVDISAEQVRFCRQRGFERVEQSDAERYLELCRESFDLVVMSDVLEHVPKARLLPLLNAVFSRLAPGGRLIVRVPNLSNPLNLRTRYVDFTHECGFSQESLGQVLRMAGFDVEVLHGAFYPHRGWLARLLFDRLAWWLFQLFYRHTMHLKDRPVRGKNLIAVGVRSAD